MAFKKWVLSDYDKDLAKELVEAHNVDALTAILLTSRGITESEQIEAFFNDEAFLIDPFTLPDMDLAVERIGTAIDGGEKIAIFGDFDADGVTSTAMLYLFLKDCGADVIYYIPDRISEGYGLNINAVNEFKAKGVSLIITVDNGISAFDEVEHANSLGIDVVVTDHHMQGSVLPNAVAVVNPHRNDSECEYSDWAGVGVAFKLICALDGSEEEILNKYADLISIGTIADIVPVLGENRIIIKKGIELLNNSKRLGIVALKAVAGVNNRTLTSTDVAFALSPRINAAGRIGSASKAVELLITDNPDKAIELAEQINEYNTQRIKIENDMLQSAIWRLEEMKDNYDRVLVIDGKDFNSGVSGIVASRICERYGKPCIIIADNGEEVLKGSCRSINGFNIFEALSACCDSLVQFGGHTLAAGLSIKREKIDEFRSLINDYASKMFRYMPASELKIDFKINPASINLDTLNSINLFQPFGMSNSKPLFGIYGAKILNITAVSGDKHVKLTLAKNDTTFTAMYFGHSTYSIPFSRGDVVDIAVSIEKNEYYGKINVSIFVKDIKFSGFKDEAIIGGKNVFENFMRNEINSKEIKYILTDRDNIAQIYRFIKENNGWVSSLEELYMSLKPVRMNFSQFMLSMKIMLELGIVIRDDDRDRYDLPIFSEKVNIPDSVYYQKMLDYHNKFKEELNG